MKNEKNYLPFAIGLLAGVVLQAIVLLVVVDLKSQPTDFLYISQRMNDIATELNNIEPYSK